jgi:hypothetical protein
MKSNLKKIAYQKPKVSSKKLTLNFSKKSYSRDEEMMLLAKLCC